VAVFPVPAATYIHGLVARTKGKRHYAILLWPQPIGRHELVVTSEGLKTTKAAIHPCDHLPLALQALRGGDLISDRA
jgi:hypothetical protein